METTFDSLVDGFNKRNEFISKIWVSIGIISIFGILTIIQQKDSLNSNKQEIIQVDSTNCKVKSSNYQNNSNDQIDSMRDLTINPDIKIPIIDISVPQKYFIPIFIILLTGLIIRWLESGIRLVRFRQDVIEPLIKVYNQTFIGDGKGHPILTRSLFDGLVYTSSTAVWGLVPGFSTSNSFNKIIRVFSYVLLKLISFIAHFILPALSIYLALRLFRTYKSEYLFSFCTYSISIIAYLILISGAIIEIKYSYKIIKERLLQ